MDSNCIITHFVLARTNGFNSIFSPILLSERNFSPNLLSERNMGIDYINNTLDHENPL